MKEKFLSRKFLIAMIMLVAGVIIDLKTERGLSLQLKDLMVYLGGIFVVGDVLKSGVWAVQKTRNSISNTEAEEMRQDMKTLHNNQAQVVNAIGQTNQALTDFVQKTK